MIQLIRTQRDVQGQMVRLWQKGHYHFQVDCDGYKLEIYQPFEEAMLVFLDVVNGFPIEWIENETIN